MTSLTCCCDFRLAKLNLQKQKEKEELTIVEKRLQDEKRARFALESQLSHEKQKRESQSPPSHHHLKNHSVTAKANDESMAMVDELRRRVKELEIENGRLSGDCKSKQERIESMESELTSLAKYKEVESRAESLTTKLCLMQEKNATLQESLSAETRFKMDLFSALGEARRQLEYANCNFIFNY